METAEIVILKLQVDSKRGIARVFVDAGTPWTSKRPGFTQTGAFKVGVLYIGIAQKSDIADNFFQKWDSLP